MGAAGGCLPVLVLSGKASNTLPHLRLVDWCSIAYLVSEATARSGMVRVLQRLEQVTAEEAAAKRAALLAVRDAFVWRPPAADPIANPSAADYLLGEMCLAARMKRAANGSKASDLTDGMYVPAGGPLSRCMIS